MLEKFYFLIFSFILLSACNKEPELANELVGNMEEYEQVANRFLSQNQIKWMSIASEYDEYSCSSMNDWTSCPSIGSSGGSLRQALKRNEVKVEDYKYYFDFLKRHNLDAIARAYDCENCVEFEKEVYGLRYSSNPGHVLEEDFEYVSVTQINDFWHS